jgi:hypothetical protein
MNAYFFNMTPEERESILDKHKHVYNGYQAIQPKISNTQPLYVQDFANDKEGLTVNNKGVISGYKNYKINESVEGGEMCECGGSMMEGECTECGKTYKKNMKEGQMCECGGSMMEGECTKCGKKYKKYDIDLYDVKDLNPKNKFDYVENKEIDEIRLSDLDPNKTYKMKYPDFETPDLDLKDTDINYVGKIDYVDGKPLYHFKLKDKPGFAQLGATDDEIEGVWDSEDLTEMENTYDYKLPAYDFKSHGPVDAYDEDDKNYFGYGRAFADMDDKNEWTDENILMNIRPNSKGSLGMDTTIDMDLSDVKEPYDFKSGGPGRSIGVYETELEEKWDDDVKIKKTGEYANKTLDQLHNELANLKKKSKEYQDKDEDVPHEIKRKEAQVMFAIRAKRNWKKGKMEEKSVEEMVDEDLKESFIKQKRKINEMFNRINKF